MPMPDLIVDIRIYRPHLMGPRSVVYWKQIAVEELEEEFKWGGIVYEQMTMNLTGFKFVPYTTERETKTLT